MNDIDSSVGGAAGEILSGLRAIVSPELEPLFWTPELLGKPSAWWTHLPFAFWLMSVVRPRVFVELGSHYGVSYAGFCEAAVRARTGSRCYAVDTWQGDKHAGYFDEAIYYELKEFHDRRYAAFSELLKCRFDDALPHFADGSIDLLHIDGFHSYEAVSHDFESWLPKLSERGVVLFHDTNALNDDFGVHRLFAELSENYPHFEFLHGWGLGVLAIGASAPAAIKSLCAINHPTDVAAVRERFSHLGALWSVTSREISARSDFQLALAKERSDFQLELAKHHHLKAEETATLRRQIEDLQRGMQDRDQARERASAVSDQLKDAFERAEAEHGLLRAELGLLKNVHDRAISRLEEQRKSIGELSVVAAGFEAAVHRNFASTFDDPSRKLKFRLKKHAYKLIGRPAKREEIAQANVIRRSLYFDRLWYQERHPELARKRKDPALHYLRYGANGEDPGPFFSARQYLEKNPDVAKAGKNPLLHYEMFGRAEGRALAKRP